MQPTHTVVLAAGANAFLGVVRPFELCKIRLGIHGAQEDGLVLVHARIGKQQRRVFIRNRTATAYEFVVLLLEKVEERLAHARGGPWTGVRLRRHDPAEGRDATREVTVIVQGRERQVPFKKAQQLSRT